MKNDGAPTSNPTRSKLHPKLERLRRRVDFLPALVRRFIRSRETGLVLLASMVGAFSAAIVAGIGLLAQSAHVVLFDLHPDERLSGVAGFANWMILLWPAAGGAVLWGITWARMRSKDTPIVDPIEANALRGGKMSLVDSAYLALQTLISNGCGASVGLEAGYTQLGSGLASQAGGWMRLRREDMRIIVGCGAAGAVAAAFNGPLTGAFYAFELVLAQYAIGYVAPIMAASITATLVMNALGGAPFHVSIVTEQALVASDFPLFILFGTICAGVGIAWMRALPLAERGFRLIPIPRATHPIIGGLLVGAIAFASPQILSGGRGAMGLGLFADLSLTTVMLIAALKMLASIVSLGSGFRGGMLFSSLLVGALLGRAAALAIMAIWPEANPDVIAFSLVGMGALGAAVVGTPLTMSFLVLETTSDYGLTGAVLAAAVTSNLIVRETFGFSFSTWRFHLSGETIRSAHDVGWARDLTVAKLMRKDPATASKNLTIGAFKALFPLGARQRVVLIDADGMYAGLVVVAEAHAEGLNDFGPVLSLARLTGASLTPGMSIKDAMRAFDKTESDVLAVVDSATGRKLLGTLKESHATRRYADEMEKAQGTSL